MWSQLRVIFLLGKSADDFVSRQAVHSVSLMVSVDAHVEVFTVENYSGVCCQVGLFVDCVITKIG